MRHSGMDCQNLGARTVSRGGGGGGRFGHDGLCFFRI